MNICVYGASSRELDESYITAVEDLGEKLAKRGHNIVYGGGAGGLMGAIARGTRKGKGRVIGVAPTFFNVDGVLFENCTEMIRTDSMRDRKRVMEERSEAFIAVPGGIGTYDELFEIMTLRQLGRHNKAIVLFNVNGYYDTLIKLLDVTAEQKFMTDSSRHLIEVFTDADELLDYLENYNPEEHPFSFMKKVLSKD